MHRKLENEELNRISVEEFKSVDKTPVIVLLDNIRSLNNIGSVFRTSDAFRVSKIILCGITAQPPHREIQKTALGATESVEWEYVNDAVDAVRQLRLEEKKVYAVEQTEESILLDDFSPGKEEIALVFGNEVKGVEQSVIDECDGVIEIPQFGTKHSLNISVSVGIVLWEVMRKIKAVK